MNQDQFLGRNIPHCSIHWPQADPIDLEILNKVKTLLTGHEHLLELIFHSARAELSDSAENIKGQAAHLSSGEYLLLLLAMDLWNGSGEVLFKNVFEALDYPHLERAIRAFA
jgi:hypothetical protein